MYTYKYYYMPVLLHYITGGRYIIIYYMLVDFFVIAYIKCMYIHSCLKKRSGKGRDIRIAYSV
jgi:hypothetical protein